MKGGSGYRLVTRAGGRRGSARRAITIPALQHVSATSAVQFLHVAACNQPQHVSAKRRQHTAVDAGLAHHHAHAGALVQRPLAIALRAYHFKLNLLAHLGGDPLLQLQDGRSVSAELESANLVAKSLVRLARLVTGSAIVASSARQA